MLLLIFTFLNFLSTSFQGWWVGLGALGRKQLFCKHWLCVGLCGLQMCCFVRGHFLWFFLSCKLSAVSFLHLAVTVECSSSKGLRVTFLSKYTEVWAGQNAWFTTETLIAATLCYQLAFFLVKRYTFLFINYFYHFVLSVWLCISKVLFFKWDISCFFRVGKASSFANFGLRVGFERFANVLALRPGSY